MFFWKSDYLLTTEKNAQIWLAVEIVLYKTAKVERVQLFLWEKKLSSCIQNPVQHCFDDSAHVLKKTLFALARKSVVWKRTFTCWHYVECLLSGRCGIELFCCRIFRLLSLRLMFGFSLLYKANWQTGRWTYEFCI